MSSLTKLSLRNRALIALITIAIAVFGIASMRGLKQELIPNIDLPGAIVVATYPGASPEVVEHDLTVPIEKAAAGIEGLKSTQSQSANSMSMVVVEVEYGTDIADTVRQLRANVDQIDSYLPTNAEWQVISGGLSDMPVVQLSATADMEPAELEAALQQDVLPELQKINDVRDAALMGIAADHVVITIDPAKLAQRGVAATDITDALETNGVVIPAGTLTDDGESLNVEIGSRFESVDEVAAIPLPTASQQGTTLADVATVAIEPEATTSVSRTNGSDSIAIAITKTPDGNTVEVSDAVQAKLDTFEKNIGHNAEFTVVFDQAPFITESIAGLTEEGLLGLVFAVVVILLFLLAISPTLVSAISIPLSLLIAMIGLRTAGYTLNILTLAALTIAIGRVVDDSIVVIENIKRHLTYGGERAKSILAAVREVAGAITASTITTVAVFLPLAFVGGQVGELFRPFAFTVAIAMGASLLVALTIIPVLAYWFMREPKEARGADDETRAAVQKAAEEKETHSRLQRMYVPSLRAALNHPIITLSIAVLLLGATVGFSTRLETNFMGDMGQNTVSVSLEMPEGTSLEATDEAAKKVEKVLADTDGVTTYQTSIGSGEAMMAALSGGGSGSNTASFSVTTDLAADSEAITAELRKKLGNLKVGEIAVDSSGMGMGSFNQVQVNIQSDDPDALTKASDQVVAMFDDVKGADEVTSNLSEEVPTVEVRVDRDKAAARGLTEAAVGGMVYTMLNGIDGGEVTIDNSVLSVNLDLGEGPKTPEELAKTPLTTPAGAVALGDIATIERVEVPTTLTRQDGRSAVTVSATPSANDLGSVTTEIQTKLDSIKLPAGTTATIGGVSAEQDEAFSQLGLALLAAIAIVYLVMVAMFKSLIQPLLLLVSVPFAATGALAGLLITGTPLGIPSMVGLLMLIGIVVTNAIVLIDLINQYRNRGDSAMDAIIEGGRHRLRPILMTAAATILALTPMALGLSGGGMFISQPLAIVVIGGLFSSTALTLIVVPVLYELVERLRGKDGKRAERKAAKKQAKLAAKADAEGTATAEA